MLRLLLCVVARCRESIYNGFARKRCMFRAFREMTLKIRFILSLLLACLATSPLSLPLTSTRFSVSSVRNSRSQTHSSIRYASVSQAREKFAVPLFLRNTIVRQDTANSSPSPQPKGYTLDPCFYHSDCLDPRLCIRGDFTASCSGFSHCICFAEETQLCQDCEECMNYPDESCVVVPGEPDHGGGTCASVYTIYEGIATEYGCNSFPNVTPISDNPASESNNTTDSYTEVTSSPVPTPVSTKIPNPSPSRRPDSPPSSTSVSILPSPLLDTSTDSAPNINGERNTEDSCIDARAMEHLPHSQRVFAEHRLAAVFCDSEGSCATPGHMVVFRSRPMSMRQYCQAVGGTCTRRVMHVNSPRLTRALRIKSSTPQLEFTAFAAKYGSRFEENALRFLIHLGL